MVRVTIYPKIYTAILDVILQFHSEGSIGFAVGELGTLHLKRRNVMGDNNLFSGFAA